MRKIDSLVGFGAPGRGIGRNASYPYLFRDLFSTDLAAGAVHGTAAQPGPGARVVTDTQNRLSIAGGELVLNGRNSAGDPGIWEPAVQRAVGRVVMCQSKMTIQTAVQYFMAFDNDMAGAPGGFALRADGAGNITIWDVAAAGGVIGNYALDTYYDIAMVFRSSGWIGLIKGGVYLNWTVLWISNASTNATWYPSWGCGTGSRVHVKNLRVADLPVPWNTDFGLATQRLAGTVAEGTTFAHEANCLVGWTTALSTSFAFRRQDDANCWRVDVAADGSATLNEVVASAVTARGTVAAGTVAAGHRCVVIADGTTIRFYSNNALRITYASAANFQTLTTGKVISGTPSDLVSWPRTISGSALAALEAVK
jgi:hypothetical protein